MGVVVSKRRVRSLLLIIPSPALGVPLQAGRPDAGGRATEPQIKGRPAAAHDWEEGPVTRTKGWGECPADRRSGAPFVPHSPHAPRARPPVLAAAPTDALISWLRGWVVKVIE